MPVYSAARLAVSGTVESIEDAAGAQLRVTSLAFASEDADANAVSGQDVRLTRCTISAGSTIVKDQDSTRSRASSAIARSGPTAVKSGSALVCIGGETHTTQFLWRPPRPWACPIATDAGASDGFVWEGHSRLQSKILQFDDDAFGRDLARPSRRPRRAGLWHYRSEKTVRQLSKNTFYRVGANWVAPVDTRAYRTRPAFPQQTTTTTPVSNSAAMWLEAAGGVATTAADPVEAVQGTAGTVTSLPLEAAQAILATGSPAPVETGQGVQTPASGPLEAGQGIAAATSDPVDAAGGVAGSGVLPVEAAQATSTSSSGPVEAAGGASAAATVPVEATGGIAALAASVLEALQGLAQAALDAIEAALGITTSASDPVESAQGVAATGPEPVEAAGAVAATAAEPLEALGGVASATSDPVESLQTGTTPVSQTGTLAIEATLGVQAPTSLQLDVASGVTTAPDLPLETVQPVPPTTAEGPVESLQGTEAATAESPLDGLADLLAGADLPIEALGFEVPDDLIGSCMGFGACAFGAVVFAAGCCIIGESPIPPVDDGGGHGGGGFSDAQIRGLLGKPSNRRIDDDEDLLVVLDLLDLL